LTASVTNIYRCRIPEDEKNIESVIEQAHPKVMAHIMADFSECYIKTAYLHSVKVFLDEK